MVIEQKMIVGTAGMPGAGKAVISRVAQGKSWTLVIMGDVIREETRKRGLEPTPENIGKIMLQLREEEGAAVVAKRCLPKIAEANSEKVLVDGIRSLTEMYEFEKNYPQFLLIGVHSSPETRFARLFRRRRSDDPTGWGVFADRDLRELSVGQGSVLALADYMIVNEGTLDEYKIRIQEVLEAVTKRWMK